MKATVFIATSLDGFIARENGAIDWLPANPEPHGYDEFIASVDGIVLGRKTFETALSFGGWFYGKTPVIVLSSNAAELKAPEGANCDFMSGDPRDIVAALEDRGIKHIYVDGGVTIQRFLEAGLIQRMIITRIPILLRQRHPALRTSVPRHPTHARRHEVIQRRIGAERVHDRRMMWVGLRARRDTPP